MDLIVAQGGGRPEPPEPWPPLPLDRQPTERVRAELVGTVLQLLVGVGDRAGAGQPLVLLESMKMEVPAVAERGGTVVQVAVEAGDVVQRGDLLVVLDAGPQGRAGPAR